MEAKERSLCLVLFTFLVISVFSTVSLFYLTAMVYIPSMKELEAGIFAVPVMCTTVSRVDVPCETSNWTSCWEWCLSDPAGDCTQLTVRVRRNGTELKLKNCRIREDHTCPHLDEDNLSVYNCKDLANYQCWKMDHGLHECFDGSCIDHSKLFTCAFSLNQSSEESHPVDCRRARNCVTLTGMFNCTEGICTQFHSPWKCTRTCPQFKLDSFGNAGVSVAILSGDRTLLAKCGSVWSSSSLVGEEEEDNQNDNEERIVWRNRKRAREIFQASCTTIIDTLDGNLVGLDCTNASVIRRPSSGTISFADLRRNVAQPGSSEHAVKVHHSASRLGLIPKESDLLVKDEAFLKINHRGCVNSLKKECRHFFQTHRYDGTNDTARSVYPCFYTNRTLGIFEEQDPEIIEDEDEEAQYDFVYSRFDRASTEDFFFVLMVFPILIWATSCTAVYMLNFGIVIDTQGQFRVRSCDREQNRKMRHQIQADDDDDAEEEDAPAPGNIVVVKDVGKERGRVSNEGEDLDDIVVALD